MIMSTIGKAYEELVAVGEVNNFLNAIHKFTERKLGRLSIAGSDTEDVVQEVLMKVYENISHYDRSKGAASTYFENIINNRITDSLRHASIKSNLNVVNATSIIDDEDMLGADDDRSLYTTLSTVDDYSMVEINCILDTLTDREKEIVTMKMDGYNLSEIAKHFGVSTTAIRKCWLRAVKKLEVRV
jgi:RNA polymerase sigma factor (sigma-70 family)